MSKIPAIIITSDANTQEIMKLYLEEFTGFEVCAHGVGFEAVREFKKSLLLVDVSDGVPDFVGKTFSECPDCKIVAFSYANDVNLVIKSMRAGAREFVSLPLAKTEFFSVLERMQNELLGKVDKVGKCRTISVFSNKGGIGKTSIASNLALELAKITKENVALIDLNFQLGDITTFMDLKPSFNISYMMQNLDKINKDFLLGTLEKYKDTNLYILADPPYFKQAEDISPKQINKLFEILKDTFSYIVVDTSAGFDSKVLAALENSDMILLTTIVNLPALRNTQRCLDLLDKLGHGGKCNVVVNRYMENDEIKIEDVEKVLDREVYWKIPNNYFTMMASINKALLVSEVSPDSNVAQSYRELALQISDNIYKLNLTHGGVSN